MLRLVLDTNIVISGLIWRGTPHLLMQALVRDEFTACTSYALVSELSRKLFGTKLAAQLLQRGIAAEQLIGTYTAPLRCHLSCCTASPRVPRPGQRRGARLRPGCPRQRDRFG